MIKKKISILVIIMVIIIGFVITFERTYSKYIITKNIEFNLSSAPFYFEASLENDDVTCDILNNATVVLNISNNNGTEYNSFETEYEIVVREDSDLVLTEDTELKGSIAGNEKITKQVEIKFNTIDGQALKSDEAVEIRVISQKPYRKEIFLTATIAPHGRRELTIEELREIAEKHIEEHLTEGMHAFDVYGEEIEDAGNLWYYERRQSDNSWQLNTDERYAANLPAYKGDLVGGTIKGQIPAYIIDRIDGVVHEGAVTSCKGLFDGMTGLTYLEDTVKIPQFLAKMEYCFRNTSITKIPKGFLEIPDGVTTVEGVFANSNISEIPNGFRLGDSVTNVSHLFEASKIKNVPESFAASLGDKITNCQVMFKDCTELVSLPNNFQLPSKCHDFSDFFRNCTSLRTVSDILRIPDDTTSIDSIFRECHSLESLPESFTIPDTMENMRYVFCNCYLLTSLPEEFTIPDRVTNLEATFYNCSSLKSLPENFRIGSSVTTMKMAFNGCTELTTIPDGLVIPASNQSIEDMLRECVNLTGSITLMAVPAGGHDDYHKAFYNTARYAETPFIVYYPAEIAADIQTLIDTTIADDGIHHGQVEFKEIGT